MVYSAIAKEGKFTKLEFNNFIETYKSENEAKTI